MIVSAAGAFQKQIIREKRGGEEAPRLLFSRELFVLSSQQRRRAEEEASDFCVVDNLTFIVSHTKKKK